MGFHPVTWERVRQALQAGLIAGEAQREEARKAAEAKAAEKKRKRDERATTRALSPRTLEKKP